MSTRGFKSRSQPPAANPLERSSPSSGFTPNQSVYVAPNQRQLSGKPRTRVVVLGGGFAGAYTAQHLAKLLGRREDVEVELLSEHNHLVFQPLLPEVAAGSIAAAHVVNPLREMLPGVRFRLCKVERVDFEKRLVRVVQGDGLRTVGVSYDHLVFCLGKVADFAAMPGVAEHALAMKDVGDAYELRNHVLRCLELADVEMDPRQRQALLTFLVAGGGFSGVEIIGELCELVTRSLRYFPNIRKEDVLFKLVHAMPEILPEMKPKLRQAARQILERRGIELILNESLAVASPDRVYLKSGRVIYTRTFVCTVGNVPNPIALAALRQSGFVEAQRGGRPTGLFATDANLQCVGKEGYWAVGDCAGIPDPQGGGLCPPTAQFAIREARRCAGNIVAAIDRRPLRPFAFKPLGALASLGQRRAVADIFGVTMTGFVAWLVWRFVYLMKLPGVVRRLRVAIDWYLDLIFPRDVAQFNARQRRRLKVHHYEPGEVIVREGQIGRDLFLIKRGEVEVYSEARAGGSEQVIARLGPQKVFGERALLEEERRSASVRCVTAVDVLVMSREDFRSLVEHFPVLRAHFATLHAVTPSHPALPIVGRPANLMVGGSDDTLVEGMTVTQVRAG